jgi:hypothetical protein
VSECIDGIIILLVIMVKVIQKVQAGNAIEALHNLATPKRW